MKVTGEGNIFNHCKEIINDIHNRASQLNRKRKGNYPERPDIREVDGNYIYRPPKESGFDKILNNSASVMPAVLVIVSLAGAGFYSHLENNINSLNAYASELGKGDLKNYDFSSLPDFQDTETHNKVIKISNSEKNKKRDIDVPVIGKFSY